LRVLIRIGVCNVLARLNDEKIIVEDVFGSLINTEYESHAIECGRWLFNRSLEDATIPEIMKMPESSPVGFISNTMDIAVPVAFILGSEEMKCSDYYAGAVAP
jgi:hypothetical protein